MKTRAHSKGLEVEVETDLQGILSIRKNSFETILEFRDYDGKNRLIPISINYSQNQEYPIVAEIKPEGTYFGKAERIRFIVNEEYIKQLTANQECDDRFLCSGRLKIRFD